MAKLTLSDITDASGFDILVNANNALIEAAIENTLSRDGTTPNTMGAALDMNSFDINNLPDATAQQSPATLAQLQSAVLGTISSISDLADVDTTGAGADDMIVFDGSNWVASLGKLTYDIATGALAVIDPGSTDAFTITPDGTNVELDIGSHSGLNIENASIIRVNGGQFNLRDGSILVVADATNAANLQVSHNLTDAVLTPSSGTGLSINLGSGERLLLSESMFIVEKNVALGSVAGQGQLWVRDDNPNVLIFTDDAGTDFNISTNTGLVFPIDLNDSDQIRFGTGNDAVFQFDGTDMLISGPNSGELVIGTFDDVRLNGTFFLEQRGSALADQAGYGQLWVESFSPNRLVYTDAGGADRPVAYQITETTANLADITASINTDDTKTEGYMVFNSVTNQPVWAVGSAAGDVWVDATGATAHTPV